MSYAQEVLDSLVWNRREKEYLGEIYFPWFDTRCSLVLEEFPGDVPNGSCLAGIQAFLDWNEPLRSNLEEASRRYAFKACEESGESIAKYFHASLIPNCCTPLRVYLFLRNPDDFRVKVILDCNWAKEYGLEWVIWKKRTLYFVGPIFQIGFSALRTNANFEPNFAKPPKQRLPSEEHRIVMD